MKQGARGGGGDCRESSSADPALALNSGLCGGWLPGPRALSLGPSCSRLPQPVETKGRKGSLLCAQELGFPGAATRMLGRGGWLAKHQGAAKSVGSWMGGFLTVFSVATGAKANFVSSDSLPLTCMQVRLRLRSPSAPCLGWAALHVAPGTAHSPDVWMPGSQLSWAPCPGRASGHTLMPSQAVCSGVSSVFTVLP